MSSISQSTPSICIPRVFDNIEWNYIKQVFEELFGKNTIERVDVVRRVNDNGDTFKRVFVHFNTWSDAEWIQKIRHDLIDGKTINIVYNDPWFWKCSASRITRPDRKDLNSQLPRITIEHSYKSSTPPTTPRSYNSSTTNTPNAPRRPYRNWEKRVGKLSTSPINWNKYDD